ncbi:matrixin family metalloprotease [Limosilactobacillus secaliphilus]|nr:matrixin family metalloprotease [Limosilactobacillus secaliphilus]
MKKRQTITNLITTLLASLMVWGTPLLARADTALPAINSSSNYFDNDDDHPNNDYAVKRSTPQHALSIPDKTPTPTEGYRWSHRRIYIYMEAGNPQVKQAFRDAVKAWNRTGTIHFVWTKKASHANVFAKSGDLSADSVNSSVGTNHSDLGSTKTSYDPDKHALLSATSTLDPNQLALSSRGFRSEVAQHELGHALGLAHAPEYENSVMIPRNVRTGITKLDRRTIKLLYQ